MDVIDETAVIMVDVGVPKRISPMLLASVIGTAVVGLVILSKV